MIYNIDSAQAFEKVLKSLNRGDEIILNPGVYAPFKLKDLGEIKISGAQGKTVIDGGDGCGVILERCTNCTLTGLTAKGAGRKYDNRQGVGFLLNSSKDCVISDCEASGFQRAGVELRGSLNCVLTDLFAHDNGYCGILATWNDKKEICRGLTLRGCRADNNPGDPTVTDNHSGNGILLDGAADALLEYCSAAYNGWDMENSEFNGPVGIWTAHADRITIRYCLSHDNRTQWGNTDGGGFDFDGGTTNSLIEYCLSWHNSGAGYLLCQYQNAPEFFGNTVRRSISVDDGRAHHKCNLSLCDCGSSARVHGGRVTECVFYNSHGRDIVSGHIDGLEISNSVFLKRGSGKFFNEWFLEDSLRFRPLKRRHWDKVRFEDTEYYDLDCPEICADEKWLKFLETSLICNARQLPDFFEGLFPDKPKA